MKSKIIPVVLGLCVLACIVLIYCLVFETRARLFYLNMGVALVSAVLLLANIPLL